MRLIESQIKAAKKDRNKLYLSVLQTEVSVKRESTVLLAHQHMYSPESHFGDADSASFRPLNPKTAFTYKSSKKSSITHIILITVFSINDSQVRVRSLISYKTVQAAARLYQGLL